MAGEFLPAGPKAKAGAQLPEPSQPSVLPATATTAQALKKAKLEEPRAPASRASTKEEPASAVNRCEEAEETEVDGGTGELLPVATATKEESDRPGDDKPAGTCCGRGAGPHGPSQDRDSHSRGGCIRRRSARNEVQNIEPALRAMAAKPPDISEYLRSQGFGPRELATLEVADSATIAGQLRPWLEASIVKVQIEERPPPGEKVRRLLKDGEENAARELRLQVLWTRQLAERVGGYRGPGRQDYRRLPGPR